MEKKLIKNIKPLGFMWETNDPFLYCIHHSDHYPKGNDEMGPAASLSGRNIGQDFTIKDGWRMYHGETVPGFPAHPHRGFETVTIVLNGFIDHSDSHGSAGRYGNGDVQWMTAGAGLQHAEMFPLLNRDKDNPLELFQLWLNLPRAKKFAKPFYKMLWAESIPNITKTDENGKKSDIKVIAGTFEDTSAPAPAPDSWAADPENEVGIWLIKMEPGAQLTLPAASSEVNRTLYFYKGNEVKTAGTNISAYHSADIDAGEITSIENGNEEALLLLLQGMPINEPVVQHGPFVMNSEAEIRQAFNEFRINQFGGWPWDRYDIVHPREKGRFAKYAGEEEEIPG